MILVAFHEHEFPKTSKTTQILKIVKTAKITNPALTRARMVRATCSVKQNDRQGSLCKLHIAALGVFGDPSWPRAIL